MTPSPIATSKFAVLSSTPETSNALATPTTTTPKDTTATPKGPLWSASIILTAPTPKASLDPATVALLCRTGDCGVAETASTVAEKEFSNESTIAATSPTRGAPVTVASTPPVAATTTPKQAAVVAAPETPIMEAPTLVESSDSSSEIPFVGECFEATEASTSTKNNDNESRALSSSSSNSNINTNRAVMDYLVQQWTAVDAGTGCSYYPVCDTTRLTTQDWCVVLQELLEHRPTPRSTTVRALAAVGRATHDGKSDDPAWVAQWSRFVAAAVPTERASPTSVLPILGVEEARTLPVTIPTKESDVPAVVEATPTVAPETPPTKTTPKTTTTTTLKKTTTTAAPKSAVTASRASPLVSVRAGSLHVLSSATAAETLAVAPVQHATAAAAVNPTFGCDLLGATRPEALSTALQFAAVVAAAAVQESAATSAASSTTDIAVVQPVVQQATPSHTKVTERTVSSPAAKASLPAVETARAIAAPTIASPKATSPVAASRSAFNSESENVSVVAARAIQTPHSVSPAASQSAIHSESDNVSDVAAPSTPANDWKGLASLWRSVDQSSVVTYPIAPVVGTYSPDDMSSFLTMLQEKPLHTRTVRALQAVYDLSHSHGPVIAAQYQCLVEASVVDDAPCRDTTSSTDQANVTVYDKAGVALAATVSCSTDSDDTQADPVDSADAVITDCAVSTPQASVRAIPEPDEAVETESSTTYHPPSPSLVQESASLACTGIWADAAKHLAARWNAVDQNGSMYPIENVQFWSETQFVCLLEELLESAKSAPPKVSTIKAMNYLYSFSEQSKTTEVYMAYQSLLSLAKQVSQPVTSDATTDTVDATTLMAEAPIETFVEAADVAVVEEAAEETTDENSPQQSVAEESKTERSGDAVVEEKPVLGDVTGATASTQNTEPAVQPHIETEKPDTSVEEKEMQRTAPPRSASYAEMAKKSSTVAADHPLNHPSPVTSRATINKLPREDDNMTSTAPKASAPRECVEAVPRTCHFSPSMGGIVKTGGKAEVAPFTSRSSAARKMKTATKVESFAGEPHILVLVSNQSLKREIVAHQQRAAMILDSNSVLYKTLDGADPDNKVKRNELFALSGLRGEYPQFFTVDGNGEPSFFGNYDTFNDANESGSLVKDLACASKELGQSTPSKSTDRVATKSSVVVLISQQSIQRNVTANQEKALSVMTSKGIVYNTIDGADPEKKTVRNNLFQVSGLRAEYPQFFLTHNGELTFWGDWEKFESCHEAGTLESELSLAVIAEPKVETSVSKGKKKGSKRSGRKHSGSVKQASTGAAKATTTAADSTSSDATSKPSLPPRPPVGYKDDASTNSNSAGIDVSGKSVTKSGSVLNITAGTDITVYGATSFVAKHALDYFMQVSLSIAGKRTITLGGRNQSKLDALQSTLTKKMENLRLINKGSKGGCIFDVFVAESSDIDGLKNMASRTKVVVNFAGPFMKHSEFVVAGCAAAGCAYVDITGEVSWASQMRLKYSDAASKSGARIISFCGFDSIPSDLAIFAAIEALRRKSKRSRKPSVEKATSWHYCQGFLNGGTVHSALEMPVDLRKCFSQPVPFLLDDPLALVHPRTRVDPDMQEAKKRMSTAEWKNQLPHIESILTLGVSAPFFMAPVNSKVVHASAIALEYGAKFTYQERFLPMGFEMTKKTNLLSVIPAVMVQLTIMFVTIILKTPVIGKALADYFMPPGSGCSDDSCKAGFAEVYTEVSTVPVAGLVDRANCSMKFEGDPGNWVTAQCVCESALALVLDTGKLPPNSKDGFGTPAELLGGVLLERLEKTAVRPVTVSINARNNVVENERVLFH